MTVRNAYEKRVTDGTVWEDVEGMKRMRARMVCWKAASAVYVDGAAAVGSRPFATPFP